MKTNYYAFCPEVPNFILVFPDHVERDEYVHHENMIAAFMMKAISEKRVIQMVGQKISTPEYDITFGCMVIEVEDKAQDLETDNTFGITYFIAPTAK